MPGAAKAPGRGVLGWYANDVNTTSRFLCALVALCLALAVPKNATAQDVEYARRNTFSVLTQYSPDSGHVLAGWAEDRQLFAVGMEYERKIYSDERLAWNWLMQVRPLILENDLTLRGIRMPNGDVVPTSDFRVPSKNDGAGLAAEAGGTPVFGHKRTYAAGANPLGMKMNFGVRHRWQPMLTGMFGFVIGSRDIPVDKSSAFNFVAEFGGGVEYFASKSQSLKFEYRFHHYSNAQLGHENPGLDAGVFQLSYSFGR